MKANSNEAKRRLWLGAAIGLALLIVAATPQTAMGQWSTDANNNIYYNAGTVGIGINATSQKLVVSANSSSTLPAPIGIIHLFGADGAQPTMTIDGYAAAPVYLLRRANTSGASPSALQANDPIGVFGVAGYGSNAYQGTRARVAFFASENWTNSANGTYIAFNTTANGAATAGGTERMRIDNNGNVGIGTTSPPTKLALQPATYSSALDGIEFTSSDNTTHSIIQPIKIAAGAMNLYLGSNSYLDTAGNFARFNASAANASVNVRSSDGTIRFNTNTSGAVVSERMQIDAAGNVGVGTTAPIARLDVRTGTVALPPGGGLDPNTYHTWFPYSDGKNYIRGTTIIADQGGYVGIGIPPAVGNKLDVAGNVNATSFSINGSTVTSSQWTNSSSDISYNIANSNVGIGTAPAAGNKLDVAGVVRSSTGGFRFPDNTVQTTAATMTGVTAGAGLIGGGTSGAATVDIGAGTGVTVAADSISVNFGSTSGTAVEGNKQITITTDGSSGLSGGAALTLGSGGTLTLTNADKGSTQNIFKSVANGTGTTQFSAGSNSDAIRFAGSGGTSVTFDAATKQVIIDGSTSTPSAANISAGQFGQNTGGGNYTFPGNVTVNGNIAAKYQDVAEWVPSTEQLPAATVVVLDSSRSNQVISSTQAYDTRVAGVISEQPGIALGESGAGKVLVATTGRVLVEVDASKSSIHIGDLLVTSDVPGVAMKSEPVNLGGVQLHRPGTLIGKALEPLEKGKGKILVLLSLQ